MNSVVNNRSNGRSWDGRRVQFSEKKKKNGRVSDGGGRRTERQDSAR